MPTDVTASTHPEHVDATRVVSFDYLGDPAFLADPFAGFDALYAEDGIVWSPHHGGFWVLTREPLIREAFQHPELFSSNPVGIPGTPRARPLIPLELDPPDHAWFRSVLAPWFSPAAVEQRRAVVETSATTLVAALAPLGEGDINTAIAQPLPTGVFVELLGLPSEEAQRFLDWNWTLVHDYAHPEAREAAGVAVASYLGQLVDERANAPQDDLISQLHGLEVQGRVLTRDELINVCYLLFIAGLDTVTAALGFCFHWLATHPEVRDEVVADPERVPALVEELLRVHAFVQTTRTVTHDTEFHAVPMKAGDRVLLATAVASRDPQEIAHGGEVELDRVGARSYAFGAGAHRCLGSHLARIEITAAIRAFHERIPTYALADPGDVTYWGGGVLGIQRLRLRWPS